MDQNQTPSFEIPKSPETPPVYSGGAEHDPNLAIEGTRETLPAPIPSQHPQPLTTPVPQLPTMQPTQAQASSVPQDVHLIADDVDVIEKEWVDRAKKIISLTSQDPFVEAKELSKLKGVYMKKRFNKDLPMAPDGDS